MKKSLILFTGLVTTALVWMGAGSKASATPLTFNGASGTFSASATFDIVGGNLQITLANTSLSDVLTPTSGGGILTALFFDLAPSTTLTPISAALGGSTVFFGPNGGGNVGGEWAFAAGLSGAPGNAGLGSSSSGFGLFGAPNFNGPDLQTPAAVDGLNYGITSAGDNPLTGNTPVTGGSGPNPVALIKSSVIFTLSGNPAFTTIGDYTISNVSFQYGTDLVLDPNITATPVPEPTAGVLLATGMAGGILLLAARRRFSNL